MGTYVQDIFGIDSEVSTEKDFANRLIDTYFRGKEKGLKERDNIEKQAFLGNLDLFIRKIFQLLKVIKNDFKAENYDCYIKIEEIDTFRALVVLNSEVYNAHLEDIFDKEDLVLSADLEERGINYFNTYLEKNENLNLKLVENDGYAEIKFLD